MVSHLCTHQFARCIPFHNPCRASLSLSRSGAKKKRARKKEREKDKCRHAWGVKRKGGAKRNDRDRDSRPAAEIKGLAAAIQTRIPRLAGDSAAAAVARCSQASEWWTVSESHRKCSSVTSSPLRHAPKHRSSNSRLRKLPELEQFADNSRHVRHVIRPREEESFVTHQRERDLSRDRETRCRQFGVESWCASRVIVTRGENPEILPSGVSSSGKRTPSGVIYVQSGPQS